MIKVGKKEFWPGYNPEDIPDPYRQLLPDDAAVVFTHADLHPSNILVSESSPCRVIAWIDWAQSGWYPDYWEFCKAQFTIDSTSEWRTQYLPTILKEPDESTFEGFETYARAHGY
jgi:aminoglycoside phosphotransferase (APT) family kinase protein